MYGNFMVLFALIITGYFLGKRGIFTRDFNKNLNRFAMYFAYPCLIVERVGNLDIDHEILINFLLMVALSFVALCVYQAICYVYARVRKFKDANIFEFATSMPNNGFMGFPVALMFFGDTGLLFMLANNLANNIYFFSVGIAVVSRGHAHEKRDRLKAAREIVRRTLTNPNNIAFIVGVIICWYNIPISEPITQYLIYISSVATPMALLFIGATLAESKVGDLFKSTIMIESAAVKLILLPVITYLGVIFLPIDPMMKAMLVLGACFPTAATASMIVEQENQNVSMCSQILFVTTLISPITIIGIINFINRFIMGV